MQNGYNPRAGLKTLLLAPISKQAAGRRADRVNHAGGGVCFRLYGEDTFKNAFLSRDPPRILENEMTSELLQLKAKADDIGVKFDFGDPPHPHPEVYLRSLPELKAL